MNIKKNVINVFTICIICIYFSNVAIAYTEGDAIKSYQLQKMDKIQTDIFELEKSIQELKQDEKGKYIDKQIDDIKADLKELENEIKKLDSEKISNSSILFWVSLFGIAGIWGIWRHIKESVDKRLVELIGVKDSELNKWLKSNEYETIKKKDTKLLVVSNTQSSKNKMKLVLNNIFDENNIEYRLLYDVESSNFEEFCELKDVIFFDNSEKTDSDIKIKEDFEKKKKEDQNKSEKEERMPKSHSVGRIEEFAEKIHEVNKSKNKNICIFYFNENGERMNAPTGFKNMNFANSESTIYSNIMDLLKYKDKVLEANKK